MKKGLVILGLLIGCLCFNSFAYAGPCDDDYEQVYGDLVVDNLTPDAIGWHGFDYQIYGRMATYGEVLLAE